MSVEVIPSGSSIVVSQEEKGWAKDAERVKDTLATMASTEAMQFANLERAAANHFENVIQDVKDAENRLSNSIASHFENVIQDVKEVEIAVERHGGKITAEIKDTQRQVCEDSGKTRETIYNAHVETRDLLNAGFSAAALAFKDAQSVAYQLAAASEKTAYQNQMATMLAFKDQAMLSEKLAAQQALLSEKLYAQAAREAAECCCELKREVAGVKDALKQQEIDRLREALSDAKILGRRFRTFSPVAPGTLTASDED